MDATTPQGQALEETLTELQRLDQQHLDALGKALKIEEGPKFHPTWDRLITMVGIMARELDDVRQHEENRDEAHRIAQQTCLDLHETMKRIGTALGLAGNAFTSGMVLERARRLTDERYELLKDKDSHTCEAESAPPTLTALIRLHEGNYRRIGDAFGIDVEQPTVHDIIEASTHIAEHVNTVEDAKAALAKRVQELEAELATAYDDQQAAERAEHDWAPLMAAALDDDCELQVAENLVRALRAEKLVRQLMTDLEVAKARAERVQAFDEETEQRRRDLLTEYDLITLALAYKWGDERKNRFIRDLTKGDLLGKLKAKYDKRMGIED